MGNDYNDRLFTTCDPEEIMRLSKIVFVEGHLNRLDDLILVILPLANMVYYKSIRYLDDREYAKEDLVSEAILNLYQDMYYRWDKYIRVDSYYAYYSMVLKNTMINLVHNYHGYYITDELDTDYTILEDTSISAYDKIEYTLLKDSVEKNIVELVMRILDCRPVNRKLLHNIFKCLYVDKSGLSSLKSRVRVLGISKDLFDLYCDHVIYVYKLAYSYQYALLGGKQKMLDRISSTIDRFEDITYKMLATEYYDSIIPEIYAEFGSEVTKNFVKTFSGRTIQVPVYKEFCDNLLGGVVLTLSQGDKANLYQVAEQYDVPYKTLSRIYNKASKFNDSNKE